MIIGFDLDGKADRDMGLEFLPIDRGTERKTGSMGILKLLLESAVHKNLRPVFETETNNDLFPFDRVDKAPRNDTDPHAKKMAYITISATLTPSAIPEDMGIKAPLRATNYDLTYLMSDIILFKTAKTGRIIRHPPLFWHISPLCAF